MLIGWLIEMLLTLVVSFRYPNPASMTRTR
jgi:hypothetical protein